VARRKGHRSGSADDEGPTYLASHFASAEVAGVLEAQIAKGRDLLVQINVNAFPQPGRADDLTAQFRAWHNYNATYLERAFTTKELRDEYEGVMAFSFGSRQGDLERMRWLAHELQRDVNKLLDIHGRLPLFEAPQQQREPAPATAPARGAPIHMTFQAAVGQVNLAEMIERADASIVQVDLRGEARLAEGLHYLTDAIMGASEAAEDQREDALDAVAVLAEVGALPPEQRGKMRGRVRGALSVIGDVVKLAPSIKQAWDAWGPMITEHMPRLGS
jgi:hypothetical protein